MFIGWYDDTPGLSTVDKILDGVDIYVERYGQRPELVLVHASAADTVVEGLIIRAHPTMVVQKNTFLIGMEQDLVTDGSVRPLPAPPPAQTRASTREATPTRAKRQPQKRGTAPARTEEGSSGHENDHVSTSLQPAAPAASTLDSGRRPRRAAAGSAVSEVHESFGLSQAITHQEQPTALGAQSSASTPAVHETAIPDIPTRRPRFDRPAEAASTGTNRTPRLP